MIEVRNKIILDQVYYNGLHSLTRFEIRNVSEHTLIVKLRSNVLVINQLNNQIAFQKTNENLPDILDNYPTSSAESSMSSIFEKEQPLTTNTVDAAMIMGNNYQFNQLFNFVNHIDQIELEPWQSQKIIIAFLAEKEALQLNQSNLDQDSNAETHDFFEVNGVLFFICFKKFNPKPSIPAHFEDEPVSAENQTINHEGKTYPLVMHRTKSELTNRSRADSRPYEIEKNFNTTPPDFQVRHINQATTKFRSRVCKSVLTTDISSTGLIFDECVAGGTYFKDFTVHNRSEIELFWVLNTEDLSKNGNRSWLKFTDYETGEPLEYTPIPAYSPKRIRITFKPLEIGEFNYDLQIENQNDSSNTIQTHIHAVVRSVLRNEKLLVSTGHNLDFGDCCTGIEKRMHIIIKNVSDTPLEVAFTSDNAGEIVFELRSDDKPTFHIEEAKKIRYDVKQSSDISISKSFDGNTFEDLKSEGNHMSDISAIKSRSQSEVSMPRTRSSSNSIESFQAEEMNNSSLPQLFSDGLMASNKDLNDDTGIFFAVEPHAKEGGERIEELTVRPGMERIIDVCYTPFREIVTPDYRTCKLAKRTFRLFLSSCTPGKTHVREKTVIQCVSRTCSSAIEVSPAEIHFGDTDVGTLKSASVYIKNCSEMPAIIELRYISKVLSSIRGELVIPANRSLEVKLDIYPRKVNPDYRKEITVANILNPDDDKVIKVYSTNIDKQRVTLHSLFYRIITPDSTHFVDFGTNVLNATIVRSISIENVTSKKLLLELSSSISSDLQIFIKAEHHSVLGAPQRSFERREQLLLNIEGRRKQKMSDSSSSKSSTRQSVSIFGNNSRPKWVRNDSIGSSSDRTSEYLDLASSNSLFEPKSPKRRALTYSAQLKSLRAQFKRAATDESTEAKFTEIPRSDGTDSNKMHSLSLSGSSMIAPDPEPSEDSVLEVSKLPLDELLILAQKETGTNTPHFSKISLEEKYVKLHQMIRKELDEQIRDQKLIPISLLSIPANQTQIIYLLLNARSENWEFVQVLLL